MIKTFKKIFYNTSLASKIRYSYIIVILPIAAVMLGILLTLWNENRRYDDMIDAAIKASQFSLDFKSDFDYETYLVIVESKSFEESRLREMLDEAESVLNELEDDIPSKGANAKRISAAKKYINNLNTYITNIESNLKTGDKYEKNIEIWENDVQIVTSLLRESILQFIYYEIQDIYRVRNEMQEYYTHLLQTLIIVMVVVIFMVIIISYVVSQSITKPIRRLSGVTEKVARGDLTARANMNTGAEVGQLADAMDTMIDRICDLLGQVKEEQQNLRKAELELLQAQINPHFLYNTLDTIVWLAEGGNQQKVVSMVGSLSDFFRTSLNQGREIVTIREELRHVGSYLEIQQVRYQDILEYEIDVPEELYEYSIPKITIQPLVENALYHGIKNRRGKGKITIRGEKRGFNYALYIEDNGIGMDKTQLRRIADTINSGGESPELFGLYNVNNRIRLKFGNRYGLHIDSTYNEGTKVSILLPCETE
ncbi:MAG: sensor histidine kinase [Lachnospiraceae bacterium]|nr:sensor histidine kinase [Candidatus Colinaster equi]